MRLHRFVRPLLLLSLLLGMTAASFAGVFVSVSVGPPPIPVYTQPLCPGPGYMWTPGYWGWGDDGYYWVPGTWVMAPEPGFLWTPGYWGFEGGAYLWHGGYWGPHVGFYGGINYGFGYGGVGFGGGEWRGRNFYYNRSVTNVNVTNVTNVYNKTVIVNNNTHVSYNGGNGVHAQPNAQERTYMNEKHVEATSVQQQHHQEAARNPQLLAKNNGGKPAIAATAKPADFSGHGAVAARAAGGPVNHAALTANAKTNTAAAGPRSGSNVPKPSGASTSTHAITNTSAGSHSVPKPPNAGSNTNAHGSATMSSTSHSAPHSSNTMSSGNTAHGGSSPHSSPQPHTAPAQHTQAPKSAPAAHNPPPSHEKPHR